MAGLWVLTMTISLCTLYFLWCWAGHQPPTRLTWKQEVYRETVNILLWEQGLHKDEPSSLRNVMISVALSWSFPLFWSEWQQRRSKPRAVGQFQNLLVANWARGLVSSREILWQPCVLNLVITDNGNWTVNVLILHSLGSTPSTWRLGD